MIRELEFQLLSQRHRDDLFRYARSLVGNSADAEDAVQEVLVRLWHQLPTLHFLNMRGWLFRTTRNYCLDQLRQRPSEVVPLDDELLAQRVDEFAVAPDDAAEAIDELARAHLILQRLPESLRSVFVLYEVNRLRYREIAAVLDLPINTVKVRLLRARQQLQHLIRKEEPCPIPSTH